MSCVCKWTNGGVWIRLALSLLWINASHCLSTSTASQLQSIEAVVVAPEALIGSGGGDSKPDLVLDYPDQYTLPTWNTAVNCSSNQKDKRKTLMHSSTLTASHAHRDADRTRPLACSGLIMGQPWRWTRAWAVPA
ncbi:hypothetical protein MHYP_G00261840 [Metynnis hypsauchen]